VWVNFCPALWVNYTPAVTEEHLETLREVKSFEYMDKVDNAVIIMETVARDTAFNEGFKMGIMFMQNFISKGAAPAASLI